MRSWVHRERDILHRQVDFVSLLKKSAWNALWSQWNGGAGERWALPYAPVKNRNCCQFAQSEWKCNRCRFIANKGLKTFKLWGIVLREAREEGTYCAQPRPHCLQSNESYDFYSFSNKAQQTETNSGYNSTSSYWEPYTPAISSVFWTCTDFWGDKIDFRSREIWDTLRKGQQQLILAVPPRALDIQIYEVDCFQLQWL